MSNHLHHHLLSLIAFFFNILLPNCHCHTFLFLLKTVYIPEEGPQGPKRMRYECFVPVKTDGTTLQ